jgi:tetratricopeptide (TPR) repeat protein
MKTSKTLLTLLAFALIFAWAASALAAVDVERYLKSGERTIEEKSEDITAEDFESVTYRGLGKQNRGDIVFVFYKSNVDFNKAEDQFYNGEYRAAIESYKKAGETGKEFWVANYSQFRIAKCYWYNNQPEKAKEYYEKLLKDHPTTPFLGEASCDLGTIYTFLKDFTKAEKILKDTVANRKLQTIWMDTANVLLGRVYSAMQDYRKAKSHFNGIVRRLEYEDQRQKCRISLAECLEAEAEANKDANAYKEAIKVYEEIVAEYNFQTLGRAYANIARCYYNLKDYQNAYWNGLRAGMHYLEVDPNLAAEGLYYAGRALLALYNESKDDETRRNYGANIKLIRKIFETRLYGLPITAKALAELK